MHICCVPSCHSRYKKGNGIQFFSFPFKRQQQLSLWIKAINRSNWSPTKWTKICSLHFLPTDYVPRAPGVIGYLKHDCIPSILLNDNNDQNSVIQIKEELMIEDDEEYEATSINPKRDQSSVIQIKEELINEEYEAISINPKYDQSSVIQEELMNEEYEATSINSKRSTHFNYDELINENKKLKQIIHDLQESMEERLNQQANMFRKLINKKETIFKKKLEITRNKMKTLNKNIQRKERKITNLKALFKELKSKNILKK